MKHVFVTGGTGFVGAYLLHYLVRRGDKVRALRRKNSPMDLVRGIESQIEWVEAELSDQRALEDVLQGIEQVYHSAAMVSFNPREAEQMFKINIEGTANMVNASLVTGVQKFVHVSSIAALGRKESQIRLDENAGWENLKTNSNYAISKFKAECEVWRGVEEGLCAAIVNPAMIIGAGFWSVGSCNFFNQMYKGFSYYPKGKTGFVDVRDVARAAIALMDSNISGERYILSGENWAYQQFLTRIAQALGARLPKRALSSFLAGVVWRWDAVWSRIMGRAPLITREVVQSFQAVHEYDSSKIIKALDFKFTPIETTITQTAKLYLESKQKEEHFALLELI